MRAVWRHEKCAHMGANKYSYIYISITNEDCHYISDILVIAAKEENLVDIVVFEMYNKGYIKRVNIVILKFIATNCYVLEKAFLTRASTSTVDWKQRMV